MSSIKNDNEFLAKNANFVLKLRLVGVGGTPQIRRVKLDRIAVSGGISYTTLVSLAIEYTFPGAPVELSDYDVALTYYDVDNDCVTIATTDELVDAVDQFSSMSPPVLRLTTDVKRKKSVRSPPSSPRRGAHASPGRSHQQERRRGTSPGRQATQQLQTLLESFVGILATAMVALQTHMNPDPSSPSNGNEIGAGSSAPSASAATAPTATEEANGTDAVDRGTATASVAPSLPPDLPRKLDEAKSFVKEIVEKMKVEKEPEHNTSERPFIHGRHTCDACLVTPIVGVRYHATNLPDYDLCSNCLGNYKGTEIQFEPVELERDRPFQERWHRRRARWAGGRGGHCRPHRRFNRGAGACSNNVDAALKEAICRSLRDAELPAKKATPKVEPVKDAVEDVEVNAKESIKAETNNGANAAQDQPAEEDVREESFSSAAAGNGSTAEAIGQTLDKCADAIDAMMSELSREMSSEQGEQEQSAPIEDANMDASPGEVKEDVSDMTSSVPSLTSLVEPDAPSALVDAECAPVESLQESNIALSGATIVEPTEAEQDARSQSSEDEWQVVTDEAQIAGDEALARAFELIGSTLFQSDVNGASPGVDAESVASSCGSSSSSSSSESTVDVSAATSVPSTVPSLAPSSVVVPLAVQARWVTQLEKLRELGFVDEAPCVEVLERLHAANIGVDEDEEVSVTQVVNELLKNN